MRKIGSKVMLIILVDSWKGETDGVEWAIASSRDAH